MTKRIDLSADPDAPVFYLSSARCEVRCRSCNWRGYRIVYFRLNLTQDLNLDAASEVIEGQQSYPSCPKCYRSISQLTCPLPPGRGNVYFKKVTNHV